MPRNPCGEIVQYGPGSFGPCRAPRAPGAEKCRDHLPHQEALAGWVALVRHVRRCRECDPHRPSCPRGWELHAAAYQATLPLAGSR